MPKFQLELVDSQVRQVEKEEPFNLKTAWDVDWAELKTLTKQILEVLKKSHT